MQTIHWQEAHHIGYFCLSSPPDNRMSSIFFNELHVLTTQIIPRSQVKAIVIYGRGRHFSAGADLNDLMNQIRSRSFDEIYNHLECFYYFRRLHIPVIAAIRGVCIGAGLELALFAHIKICEKGAYLSLPESSFDLLPGVGGIQNFFTGCGEARTIEYALSGDSFSPEVAREMNLIDHITPKNQALKLSERLARFIMDDYNPLYIKENLNKLLATT
mgnify:CR=1 FL=1